MRQSFPHKILSIAMVLAALCVSNLAIAGNNRIMSINAARVTAERALVETVYGLKLRATEEVRDLVAANFEGKTESKTAAMLKGVKFEEITYDPKQDIAKAVASVSLDQITNVNGDVIPLNNKVFRRVGFGTSTPSKAGPLKALRAAEIDAYKQLMKQLVGFQLESETSVENYMLKSDVVRTKVMATLFLAEITEFGWESNGDAYIKMVLNVRDVSDMLGQKIVSDTDMIEVEGLGAQDDDFGKSKQKK